MIALDYKLNFQPDADNKSISELHQRVGNRLYNLFISNGGLYIKFGESDYHILNSVALSYFSRQAKQSALAPLFSLPLYRQSLPNYTMMLRKYPFQRSSVSSRPSLGVH
jgi:hypothetical protein